MSAEEKDVPDEPAEEQPVAEEPKAEKAEAKKAPAKKPAAKKAAAAEGETKTKAAAAKKPAAKKAAKAEGENAPEKQRRRKKPAEEPVAAPGDATEAKEAAKAKPSSGGKAAPKAARRRVVSAKARYVRTSARKARMVCGHLRGKSVQEARAILAFTPREVARDWSKLLESAVANAESNHELVGDDLIVREAYADEGPTIKRFRPRAMGRATPIRKRTSHLTITLTPAPENQTGRRKG
jgi:ribosomal protein L22